MSIQRVKGIGLAAMMIAAGAACASDWDSLVTFDDVHGSPPTYGFDDDYTAGELPALVIPVDAREPYPEGGGRVFIPLDEFERAGADDAALRRLEQQADKNSKQIQANTAAIQEQAAQVAKLEAQVKQLEKRKDEQNSNVAAIGAIDFQRPLEGKAMRLAMGSAAVEDQAALGISFSAVLMRTVDMAVGVGLAEHATVGKASVGISF